MTRRRGRLLTVMIVFFASLAVHAAPADRTGSVGQGTEIISKTFQLVSHGPVVRPSEQITARRLLGGARNRVLLSLLALLLGLVAAVHRRGHRIPEVEPITSRWLDLGSAGVRGPPLLAR